MARDTFTEVTNQSWFSRIKDSVLGVFLGLALFAGSFVVLWLNEGRALETANALREVGKTVISLASAEVSPQNEGKPVHLTGKAETAESPVDEITGVSINAVKLQRDVEMYQWVESSKSKTREKLGGSKETVTTYTYETKWSSTPQDSADFKKPEGHANPEMAYAYATFTAGSVSLGQFMLSPGLIDKIRSTEALVLGQEALGKLPASLQDRAVLSGDYLYLGTGQAPDPNAPQVGDYRLRYRFAPAGVSVSVISTQTGNTFAPYQAKNGRTVELLESGIVSADVMVKNALKSNQLLTWLLRLLGFVLMFIGLGLIFKPLSTIGAVVPLFGRILGAGAGLVAFLLSLAFSLITIAVAWLYYRPILAIILFAIALLPVVLIIRKKPAAASGIPAK